MNEFEAKRERRIERLRRRSVAKMAEATATSDAAHKMLDAIPFGQPILVGHHSEKRDRNFRDRIGNKIRKAGETSKEATELQRRADAAENNDAISSDDPDAISKLKGKLIQIEKGRAMMVEANKIIRQFGTGVDVQDTLVGLGLAPHVVARVLVKDPMGNLGFPAYRLTNEGSEARRIRQRIEQLEALASKPVREPVKFGDIEIKEADNRIQIIFPGKPSDTIRSKLKANGFRWAPSNGAWQRMASGQVVWDLAVSIAILAGVGG